MQNRTVIVILSIAALLLLFIVFFERDMMTSTQRGERKNHVFVSYDQNLVDEIIIQKAGEPPLSLQRQRAADGEPGNWQIVAPRQVAANEGEVRLMLSSIDFLLIERRITDTALKKEAQYGLATPRISVSYTMKGQKTVFHLGSETKDEKVYLALDGLENEFYAVERDFLSAFDKKLEDLRSRKIFSDSLGLAAGIDLRNGVDEISLQRKADGGWDIKVGAETITAAEDEVSALIQSLGDIEAESFIADDVDDNRLGQYGLQAPSLSVAIAQPSGKRLELKIGDNCKGEEHRRYLTLNGTGTVVCADDDFLSVLGRPKDRFIEKRLAIFHKDEVNEISLAQGKEKISFRKTEGEWKFEQGGRGDVEQQAVLAFLDKIATTRADSIDTGAEARASLEPPLATVTLSMGDDSERSIALAFHGDPGGENVRVRRGEENALLLVTKEILEQVRPNHLAFLKRTIDVGPKDKLERIEIRGSISQTLVKKDGLWKIVEPLDIASDPMAVRSLSDLLATVRAQEFVSAAGAPSHGFENPQGRITTQFAVEEQTEDGQDLTQTQKVVLEIGNRAGEKGWYARLIREPLPGKQSPDGPSPSPVFLVEQKYADALDNPLVARDLMQLEETNLSALTLEAQGKKLSLRHEENSWVDSAGRPLDTERLSKILADLGATKTIRAHGFHIEPKLFSPPALVIHTAARDDADEKGSQTFVFGQKSADPVEDGYLAHDTATPVVHVFPARVVNEVISFMEAVIGQPTDKAGQK